jgi:hypothetical protein
VRVIHRAFAESERHLQQFYPPCLNVSLLRFFYRFKAYDEPVARNAVLQKSSNPVRAVLTLSGRAHVSVKPFAECKRYVTNTFARLRTKRLIAYAACKIIITLSSQHGVHTCDAEAL